MSKTIRIISALEGFRRAGVAHSVAATDHPIDSFDEGQIETLKNEPKLIVQILDDPAGEGKSRAPLDEARKAAIITAMQAMMQADPERKDEGMWTKGLKPELDNLRKRLKEAGADVVITQQDRDKIWAEIKPA